MTPRIGSLFSGYGGLDMGVQAALGGSVAWHVEYDKAPSKILAHHWPDVPNYGDVTAVDWSQVEPVDIITGGSPCQDLSHAGKRQGMTEGTRSNLWVAMREAIAQLRPGLVVWENVRGAYSAEADSELESCPRCVGDPRDRGPVLRALGRVLGDLSDLGYVGGWHGLRAADVGAPHGRFRVFVVAYTQGDARWLQHGDGATTALPVLGGRERRGSVQLGWASDDPARDGARSIPLSRAEAAWREANWPAPEWGWDALPDDEKEAWREHVYDIDVWRETASDDATVRRPAGRSSDAVPALRSSDGDGAAATDRAPQLLPTPRTSDTNGAGHHGQGGLDLRTAVSLMPTPRATDGTKGGPNQRGSSGDLMLPSAVTLLPTPAVNDMGEGKTPEAWDEWTAKMQAAHGNGNGHGKSLAIEAQRLLPTPNAGDAKQGYVTREEHDARAAVKRAANPNLGDLHEDLPLIAQTTQDWGIYADAIARWEHLTRPAPAPTQPSKKGTPQLSPAFSEWLMGLPVGHVTDVPGLSRNDMLKALGNGVVPQQAEAALRFLLGVTASEAVA